MASELIRRNNLVTLDHMQIFNIINSFAVANVKADSELFYRLEPYIFKQFA